MTSTKGKNKPTKNAPPPPMGSNSIPMLGEEEVMEVEAAPLPTDGELSKVRALAQLQLNVEARMARGEALLKALKAYHREISERQLPLAMKSLGMKDFTLLDGSSLEAKDFVVAGIPKTKTAEAHAWLEDTKRGDLIKHVLTVSFGRGEEAWAKKFMADLARRKRPLAVERTDSVNYQTLNAFVREEMRNLRAKGIDPFTVLPKELLGIYEGTHVELKLSPAAQKALDEAVLATVEKAVPQQSNSAGKKKARG